MPIRLVRVAVNGLNEEDSQGTLSQFKLYLKLQALVVSDYVSIIHLQENKLYCTLVTLYRTKEKHRSPLERLFWYRPRIKMLSQTNNTYQTPLESV